MRTALIPALGVFIWLGAGLSSVAQERAALERPAVRVSSAAVAPASEPMQSAVLGYVANAPSVGAARQGRRPMAGESYSRSAVQLRAILGIPGASMLTGQLALSRDVQAAYIAPGQNYALVEQYAGPVALLQFNGTQVSSPLVMPGALRKSDIVTFSPNALSAAIFSAEEGRLLVLNGLPSSPQLSRDLSAADLPSGIRMLALADDGATLLAGTNDGRVLILRAGGAPQLLYRATDPGGIAFAPASTDALVFDRDGAKALLLQNVASAPSIRTLAEGLPGLSGVIALQFDRGFAMVGAVKAKSLSRIDLQTLRVESLTLTAGLTMLQPLHMSGRFLLSAEPGQPAWILDTSSEASTVYFVPPQRVAMMAR